MSGSSEENKSDLHYTNLPDQLKLFYEANQSLKDIDIPSLDISQAIETIKTLIPSVRNEENTEDGERTLQKFGTFGFPAIFATIMQGIHKVYLEKHKDLAREAIHFAQSTNSAFEGRIDESTKDKHLRRKTFSREDQSIREQLEALNELIQVPNDQLFPSEVYMDAEVENDDESLNMDISQMSSQVSDLQREHFFDLKSEIPDGFVGFVAGVEMDINEKANEQKLRIKKEETSDSFDESDGLDDQDSEILENGAEIEILDVNDIAQNYIPMKVEAENIASPALSENMFEESDASVIEPDCSPNASKPKQNPTQLNPSQIPSKPINLTMNQKPIESKKIAAPQQTTIEIPEIKLEQNPIRKRKRSFSPSKDSQNPKRKVKVLDIRSIKNESSPRRKFAGKSDKNSSAKKKREPKIKARKHRLHWDAEISLSEKVMAKQIKAPSGLVRDTKLTNVCNIRIPSNDLISKRSLALKRARKSNPLLQMILKKLERFHQKSRDKKITDKAKKMHARKKEKISNKERRKRTK